MSISKTLDKNIKQVNGPINVVRLQGKIGSVNKVVYLFMDRHLAVEYQTECDNIFAKDVHMFFADSFKNIGSTGKTYDFFLEKDAEEITPKIPEELNTSKTKYISEVGKMFKKIFKYDPKANRALTSDIFQNTRFHYIDFRGYLYMDIFEPIDMANYVMENIWNKRDLKSEDLNRIAGQLNIVSQQCQLILQIMDSYSNNKNRDKNNSERQYGVRKITPLKYTTVSESYQKTYKQQKQIQIDYIRYFINKIYTKYNDNTVKSKLINRLEYFKNGIRNLNTEVNNIIVDINNIMTEMTSSSGKLVQYNEKWYYGMPYEKEIMYIADLYNKLRNLNGDSVSYIARLIDIYFLRRFLDKDYITNAILYSGANHSLTDIDILVKDFDFKITHVAYSKYPINQITNSVKKAEFGMVNIQPLFDNNEQCSDVTHFPDNFM
ncbi:hypothetical protein qu_169 [Acanthamoeba polyphaga mimivirus]|nr:hypothetical protein [Mimivirus reunion]WMV61507.1 hypothetical protein qu_169 [Mimivirus sp.]WMV62484.1 hypothetical protein qu_169 [Acanthamoeba polyphaga mimivirus]WMV63461.1 hypothetical protein qu_169 [Mimivirus sp.]